MAMIYLVSFWFTMVFHQTFMKLADVHKDYWWQLFLVGNAVAVPGTIFIMLLHGRLPGSPGLVVGLCMGGGFLLAQAAMAVINWRISAMLVVGAVLIAAGMVIMAAGAKG